MNFVYLAQKHLGVSCLCENRTYGGLIWPVNAGEKPSYETFEAFQRLEDRVNRVGQGEASRLADQRLEAHKQAMARALQDIVPYEEQIKSEHEEIRKQSLEQQRQALEVKHALESRAQVEHSWQEISSAQEKINEEAKRYLHDTDHLEAMSRSGVAPISDEVASKRRAAMCRIKEGEGVFANWQALRNKELPTKEELRDAILAGGEQLERIRKICKDVALKYPKPRKTHY